MVKIISNSNFLREDEKRLPDSTPKLPMSTLIGIHVELLRERLAADRKRIEELEKERDATEGLIHVNEKLNLRILNLKGQLENIHDIAVGYDGYGDDVKKLQGLINELREIARQALARKEES